MARRSSGSAGAGLGHNTGSAEILRSIVERIERLEAEKKEIADQIREVYDEAGSQGFHVKIIRQIVRDRQMTQADLEEREALLDIYRAALGMLNGTPLGEAAVRRLQPKPPPADEPPLPLAGPPPATSPTAGDPARAGPAWAQHTVEDARAAGAEASRKGEPVTANPYPAHDARRAAWDEGWCQAAGGDGMEIPAAWRRTPKPKPGADTPPGGDAPPATPDSDPEEGDER